ncbi:MAG: hypothetical protein GY762_15585 [Proteobacteria bacterium]|nr:hypothetical protein [Pseudomonadota bacterium]
MSEIDWNLRPGHVYHLILRAEEELFSSPPLSAIRHIVGSSVAMALRSYPINLHCAGASATDLELLFSVTEKQCPHVRSFFEKLIETAEEAIGQFYPDAPERLFCNIRIERCKNNAEANRRMAQILSRPVEHGYVTRAADWQGYRTYGGHMVEQHNGFTSSG